MNFLKQKATGRIIFDYLDDSLFKYIKNPKSILSCPNCGQTTDFSVPVMRYNIVLVIECNKCKYREHHANFNNKMIAKELDEIFGWSGAK